MLWRPRDGRRINRPLLGLHGRAWQNSSFRLVIIVNQHTHLSVQWTWRPRTPKRWRCADSFLARRTESAQRSILSKRRSRQTERSATDGWDEDCVVFAKVISR